MQMRTASPQTYTMVSARKVIFLSMLKRRMVKLWARGNGYLCYVAIQCFIEIISMLSQFLKGVVFAGVDYILREVCKLAQ